VKANIDDSGTDQRKGDLPERRQLIGAEIHGCLLERRIEAMQPRGDQDEHIGKRESDMGDQGGGHQAWTQPDRVEKDQQCHADRETGDHKGQQEQSNAGDLAAELGAKSECGQATDRGGEHGGGQPEHDAVLERDEQ
jgi:hypothetical protein